METWFLLSLGTMVFWGVGQVLAKKGLDNVSPLWNNIFANILALFIWVPPMLILSGFAIKVPPLPILFLIFLNAATYMIFYYAISHGAISLTGTVYSTYPATTILLSAVFLHERLLPLQLLGVILAVGGCVILSLPDKKEVKRIKNYTWLKWAIAASLLAGLGDFFAKVSVNNVGPYMHTIFITFAFQILTVINYLVDKKGRKLPKFTLKNFLPTLAGIAVLLIGTLFLFLSLEKGIASVVVPITSANAAIVVILAIIFLKEKLTRNQLIGVAGTIAGVILLGLS